MCYVMVPGDGEKVLAVKFAVMRPLLDERQWRVYLGTEARALGHGGIAAVSRVSGASESTVSAGIAEAGRDAEAGLAPGQVRRPGGGRKKLEVKDPGLAAALREVVEAATRGDPVLEITWCSLSLREIGRRLAVRGFWCGKDAVARMLREQGYSLQGMSRVLEGKQHPDRDAQFGHINAMIAGFGAAGDPVVSVDGKKKEQLGPFGRAGRSWRPAGDPVRVRDHDFPDEELGRIVPYGVYDIAANRGFVSVGTSADTAAFAVNALRLWWQQEGSLRYPGATRLLVTCDAGGSNSATIRLWKDQLAVLAAETGLEIWVCHFPPGTSKWNKIEHRLFCHITRTWRARPLMTAQDAVAGIAATSTVQGLKCTAVLDQATYRTGTEISDERMRYLEERILDRQDTNPGWNYAVRPVPRPAPDPGPDPGPGPPGPDPALLAALAALAGVPAPDSLLAQARLAWTATREYRLTMRLGHDRYHGTRPKTMRADAKLTPQAVLVAAACRVRLGMTWTLLGQLLGVYHSTISGPAGPAITILARHGITAQPGTGRISTLDQLRQHATASGITIPAAAPEHRHPPPPGTTTRPN
jgi:transposase